MDALAELCAEQGYEATKISDVVRRAKVARKTLYDNFDGKEEVFLAAFDAAHEEVLARVEESCRAAGDTLRERVEAALGAFLGFVAEQPVTARLCMVEALSATPMSTRRYEDAMESFVAVAARGLPRSDGLPPTMGETLVGGVAWIVYRLIRRDEAERAMELLPDLTDFVLAPFDAGEADNRER